MRFFPSRSDRSAKNAAARRLPCVAWLVFLSLAPGAKASQAAPAAAENSPSGATYEAKTTSAKSAVRGRRRTSSAASKDPTTQVPAAAPPPAVRLRDGILTIEASNADLGEILKQVADVSGMVVAGSVRGARVYGSYGPGDPRDVLTTLLTGSGYNFIMTGATRLGAPGELQLSLENGAATPAAPPVSPTAAVAAVDTRLPSTVPAQEEELAPGVIAHVPPPPSEDPQERVQQNLKRLQQIRDPQNQQNAPQ